MSSFGFSLGHGPILVAAELTGPAGTAVIKLALDTGATASLLSAAAPRSVGFDPGQSSRRTKFVTGSIAHVAPLVTLTRLSALGQHRFGFSVIAHNLPPGTAVAGLLGLDFLQAYVLTIDFPAGRISLA